MERSRGVAAIKRYLWSREQKPMLLLHPTLLWIHSGTQYEAEVTLDDLKETVAYIDELETEVEKLRSK